MAIKLTFASNRTLPQAENQQKSLNLGVIADTHVPDRLGQLRPGVLQAFESANVKAILHAGDISVPRVLDELRQVAPVYAVRGNRDWIRLRRLPPRLDLNFDGVRIGLIHGQGNLWRYLWNKFEYYRHRGYKFDFYQKYLLIEFPQTDVVIFGHSHIPECKWIDRQLLFNPGSACCWSDEGHPPSIGLLHLQLQSSEQREIAERVPSQIRAELVKLA